MSTPFADLDACACAELVGGGDASPVELVEAAIGRIEALDPQLNAVIHRRFERAVAEASAADLPDGPFRGVPLLVKDLWCHTAGDPNHRGMRLLKELAWTEAADTYLAAKFRAAGFVIVGRTNTPELGLLPTTEPDAYGPTRNPWDLTRTPGGSSGGSAAAVAAGLVPLAHASDGGGSIRIPASACGLVGLKPSRGRVSNGPFVGELTGGLSVEHVVSRSVRDVASVLDVVAGAMPGDPVVAPPPARPYREEVLAEPRRLRIGLLVQWPGAAGETHPDCVRVTEDAARLLSALGHVVEEGHPPALGDAEGLRHFTTLAAVNVSASLDHWSRRTGHAIGVADVETLTWAAAELGRTCSGPQLALAQQWIQLHGRKVGEWWSSGFDLLLTPTLAEPPPPLGTFASTPENPLAGILRAAAFCPFTPLFNATGQPAISLPLGCSGDGLPIGVQLVAAYGREDVLVRAAAQLERAQPWRPWSDRRPRVAA